MYSSSGALAGAAAVRARTGPRIARTPACWKCGATVPVGHTDTAYWCWTAVGDTRRPPDCITTAMWVTLTMGRLGAPCSRAQPCVAEAIAQRVIALPPEPPRRGAALGD